jgi:hypothetical protein
MLGEFVINWNGKAIGAKVNFTARDLFHGAAG